MDSTEFPLHSTRNYYIPNVIIAIKGIIIVKETVFDGGVKIIRFVGLKVTGF